MSLPNSFRFYELPDIQRTIDIIVGVIMGFSIQHVWRKRVALVNSYNLILWYLSITTSIFFYETSKAAKAIRFEKGAEYTRTLSTGFLIYGSTKVGKRDEIFFSIIFTALASKKTPEESKKMAVFGLGMFLFAKALSKKTAN